MLWPLSWEDDNWRSMIYTLGISYHALTVVTRRWQMTEHDSNLRDILPCSDCFQETTTTDGAWFLPKGYLTMLWLLSLDENNWRSMVHTLGIYYHAPTVVTRRWHMTEHDSYLRDKLPCSDRCHVTMTSHEAYFVHEWYIIMLWPLLLDDDNWRSMFHTWCLHHHAFTVVMRCWQLTEHDSYQRDKLPTLTVVIRRWQLTEHVSYLMYILPCSDRCVSYMNGIFPCFYRCHEMLTTDGAWFLPKG